MLAEQSYCFIYATMFKNLELESKPISLGTRRSQRPSSFSSGNGRVDISTEAEHSAHSDCNYC
jgi:hypothetical protein